MRISVVYLAALAFCVVSIAYASIPSASYSLNFHFIPPLVSAPCSFATVWNPTNMTCAMCFCLNGRISRCVPQPGCSPFPNNATSTTPAPGSAPVVAPGPDAPVLTPGGSPSPPVLANSTNQPPPPPVPDAPVAVNGTGQSPTTTAPPSVVSGAPGRFRQAKLDRNKP